MVVAAFNQEKALVEAFSVITNLRMDLFEALECPLLLGQLATVPGWRHRPVRGHRHWAEVPALNILAASLWSLKLEV